MQVSWKQLCNGLTYLHNEIVQMNNKDISKKELHFILVNQFEVVAKYLLMLRTFNKFKSVIVGGNEYMGWVLTQQYNMLKTLPDYIDIFSVQEMVHTPELPIHWPKSTIIEVQDYKDVELYSHLKLLAEYYIQIDHHVNCMPLFPDKFVFTRHNFYTGTFQFDTHVGYWKLIELDFLDELPIDKDQLQSQLLMLPPCPIPMILVNYDRYLFKYSIERKLNAIYKDAIQWTKANQHTLIRQSPEEFYIKLFPDSTVLRTEVPLRITFKFELSVQKKSLPLWLAEKLQLVEKEQEERSSKRKRRKSKQLEEFYEFQRDTPILSVFISSEKEIKEPFNIYLEWIAKYSKITFTTLSDHIFKLDASVIPFFSFQKSFLTLFDIFKEFSSSITTQYSQLSKSGFELDCVVDSKPASIALSSFPIVYKLNGYLFDQFKSAYTSPMTIYAISTTSCIAVGSSITILKCVHGSVVHYFDFKHSIENALIECAIVDLQHRLLFYRIHCSRLYPLISHCNQHCLSIELQHNSIEIVPCFDPLGISSFDIYLNKAKHTVICSIQDVAKLVLNCKFLFQLNCEKFELDQLPSLNYILSNDLQLVVTSMYHNNQSLFSCCLFHSLSIDTTAFESYLGDHLNNFKQIEPLLLLVKCVFIVLRILQDWDATFYCQSLLQWRLSCKFVSLDISFTLNSTDYNITPTHPIQVELPAVMKHYCSPSVSYKPTSLKAIVNEFKANEEELMQCQSSMSSISDSTGDTREMPTLQPLHHLQGSSIDRGHFQVFFQFLNKCSWSVSFIEGLKKHLKNNTFFKSYPELIQHTLPTCLYFDHNGGLFIGPIFTAIYIFQQFKSFMHTEEMLQWMDYHLQSDAGQVIHVTPTGLKQRTIDMDHYTVILDCEKKGFNLKLTLKNAEHEKVNQLINKGQEHILSKLNASQHQQHYITNLIKLLSITPVISVQMIQLMLTTAKLRNSNKSDVSFEILLEPQKDIQTPLIAHPNKVEFYLKSTTVEKVLVTKYHYLLAGHKLEYQRVIGDPVDELYVTKVLTFQNSTEPDSFPERIRLGKCLFKMTSLLHE